MRDKSYPGIVHLGILTALTPLFGHRAPVLEDIAAFATGAHGVHGS